MSKRLNFVALLPPNEDRQFPIPKVGDIYTICIYIYSYRTGKYTDSEKFPSYIQSVEREPPPPISTPYFKSAHSLAEATYSFHVVGFSSRSYSTTRAGNC